MKRLVLVRHGESRWNAEGRIQGQQCAGLSDVGHQQARAVAARVADAWPDARLVTSDLQRCLETTAPITLALDRVPLEEPRLRERSFGDWSGRLRDDVAAEDADRWRRWGNGEDVISEIGGESAEELGARVEPALRELLEATPENGVSVAVTHGGPIWHGLHVLLGLPFGSLGPVANAGISEVIAWQRRPADGSPEPERLVMDRWNDVGHLPPGLRTGFAAQSRTRRGSDAPPVGR